MFCPHCGKKIELNQTYCRNCGARISKPDDSLSTSTGSPPDESEKPAWERRDSLGLFKGLFITLKDVLATPANFFKRMPVQGGLTDPLLYGLIIGMAGLIFSYLWHVLFPDTMKSFMASEHQVWSDYPRLGGQGLVLAAVLTPFTVIAWMFVATGLLHLILSLLRGARAGFEATFRVVAYSVSPYFFTAIPFCGNLVAPLWSLVLIVIGLKEAHKTSGGKAIFTVFFPVILFCGFAATVLALFMGAIVAFFGGLSLR